MDDLEMQNDAGSSLDYQLLDKLIEQASTQDLKTFLQKALSYCMDIFQAEAGFLYFHTLPPLHIQVGTCAETVKTHVTRLENVVADRLENGTWRVLEAGIPPISTHKFDKERVILLNTPLLKSTQVTGSLSLILPASVRPSLAHRTNLTRLARSIGHLTAISADLSLTQKRYRELDLIYKLGQAMVTTLDVQTLMNDVMRLSANVLNAASASIMLLDEETQELVFAASHSPRVDVMRKARISLDEGIAGWVAKHGRPAIVNDVTNDPRFHHQVDTRTGFLTQSIAAVPLKLKGHTIGVLEVINKQNTEGFDEEDLRLISSIAAQATIALENAKLYQSLRDERDKIIQAIESVRQSLARNLHDGAIQQLSAISMNLEYLRKLALVKPEALSEEIDTIQTLVNKATKEARLVLFELRPLILESEGLLPALQQYVKHLRNNEDFIVDLDLPTEIPHKLSKGVAGTIFSILQEAISNAKKHAKASSVRLSLAMTNSDLIFEVQDNGRGFSLDRVESGYASRTSLGMLNMKERAELLEGELKVQSQQDDINHGTKITLTVPIKRGTKPLQHSIPVEEDTDE